MLTNIHTNESIYPLGSRESEKSVSTSLTLSRDPCSTMTSMTGASLVVVITTVLLASWLPAVDACGCVPVNCAWGPYGDWSACNCQGKRYRDRSQTQQAACGGTACSGAATEWDYTCAAVVTAEAGTPRRRCSPNQSRPQYMQSRNRSLSFDTPGPCTSSPGSCMPTSLRRAPRRSSPGHSCTRPPRAATTPKGLRW